MEEYIVTDYDVHVNTQINLAGKIEGEVEVVIGVGEARLSLNSNVARSLGEDLITQAERLSVIVD